MASFPPLPDATASEESALRKASDTLSGMLGSSDPLLPMSSDTPSTSMTTYTRPSTPSGPPLLNVPPAQDPLLHFFTSMVMKDGKRQLAQRITSRTLLYLHTFTRAPPLPILRKAILTASPAVRIASSKVGAKTVHRPIPLTEKQRTFYGILWIKRAAEKRPGMTAEERLARELIAVIEGSSPVLKIRDDIHKMATVNRGNAGTRV
ncbi:ribosomal protein S7 [Neolentinus lepideus HHB14362 ss-1]|uniref:Ribosomal protein S7 n=1 Tax=Neolentinus lepideus HHB14362 ss-1 TaxID=1314782 RepID=A0A165RJP6_9AGAM|nr:ribosomal protein S7 [Neolentinus lepideus HHB14362 ss-1]